MSRRISLRCFAVAMLPLLVACGGEENSTPSEEVQPPCDVLREVQVRLGPRIVSPAPAAGAFESYVIIDREAVVDPFGTGCSGVIAASLQELCVGCNRDTGNCATRVRMVFDNPPSQCSACGDGACVGGETAELCPEDCGVSCGDGACSQLESALSCPVDCAAACGDSVCSSGESPASCPVDCNYTVGDGLCEPGENPQVSPADCRAATCGDGYCQSYETSLLCPQDCCFATLCEQSGPICTGSHTLAACNVAGIGNCPEIVDEQACELGCAWIAELSDPECGEDCGFDPPEARCRTCEDLFWELFPEVRRDSIEAWLTSCEPGGPCATRDVFVDFQSWIEDQPSGYRESVPGDCAAVPGFAACTYATPGAEPCPIGEACDGSGACESCEEVARATGLYPDLDTADYVFGCIPGDGVCARATDDDPGNSTGLRDVVTNCAPIPGHPTCTIGQVVEDCGIYQPAPEYAECRGGVCSNCLGAARNKGIPVDTVPHTFGCDVAVEPTCFLGRSHFVPGEVHALWIDACATVEGSPNCPVAEVLDDCGPQDDGVRESICDASSSGCVSCSALFQNHETFVWDPAADYVYGCSSFGPSCLGTVAIDCQLPGNRCSIGERIEDCADRGPGWTCEAGVCVVP